MADKKTLEMQIKIAAAEAIRTINILSGDFKNLGAAATSVTSNTDNIKRVLKDAEEAARRASTSFKLFGGSSQDLKNVQQQLKSTVVSLVNNGFEEQSDEVQNLVTKYKELSKESDALENQEQGLFGAISKLKNELGNLATVTAAVKIDTMLTGAVGGALEAADSFDMARKEWGVLLGDMEAGAAVFDNILKPFNDKTPFEIDTIDQAAKVLRAAGVETKDLTTWLTRLGDLAQGNAQKMESYAKAFSKASAKGKADMEVLNILIDQGVPILGELAKQAGVTSEEIVSMASAGEISFENFTSALESMTNQGGQYYGNLELASKSLSAMQAGLDESVKTLAASMGQMLLPTAIKILEALTNIVNATNDSPLLKGILLGAITALTTAINVLAAKSIVALITKLWSAYAAQMSLNSATAAFSPVMLGAIAAVGVAVGAYAKFAAEQQDVASSADAAALAVNDEADAFEDFSKRVNDMSESALRFNLEGALQLKQELTDKIEQAEKVMANPNSKWTPTSFLVDKDGNNVSSQTVYEKQEQDVAALNAQLEQLNISIEMYQKRLNELENAGELEEANAILEHRNKLYAKTKESQIEEIKAELEFAKSLKTLQTLNEDGTYSPFNQKKTDAIIGYLEDKLEELEQKASLGTTWQDKIVTGIDKIKAEEIKALNELQKKAIEAYGDQYNTQADYLAELSALSDYYNQQRADAYQEEFDEKKRLAEEERQNILNAHQEKLKALKEEFEYQRELARQAVENGGGIEAYGAYAGNSAMAAISDTDLFSTIMGANPIIQLIEALIEALVQIESINKILNWAHTIINSMMEVLEPIIDQIFKPIADLLEEIGRTIGYILAPVLNAILAALAPAQGVINIVIEALRLVGKVFQWLNNHVIVPFGNAVIDIVNGIIGLINLIPGVDIKKVEKLQIVGEMAEELADAMEKATEECKKKYERQKDAVEDLLSAQLNSLKNQYELGLITRNQYNAQAEAFQKAADDKLLDINKEMLNKLKNIEANTKAGLTPEQAKAAEEAAANGTQKWYEMDYGDALADKWSHAGNVAKAAGQILGDIADTVTAPVKWVAKIGNKLGWWDVGSTNIPKDQFGMVHQGEAIIPRTFAEGIRRGDMALVGGKSSSSVSQPVNVIVNVGGSVVTERQLVDVVYDGIARAIGSGEKSPLPEAA